MRSLWYTGYVVSGLTYLALLYVESQIPGFVSQVFPSYIVLLMAVGCGVVVLLEPVPETSTSRLYAIASLAIGALLAIVMFRFGDVFGAYRLVMAIVVLVLPVLMYKSLEHKERE